MDILSFSLIGLQKMDKHEVPKLENVALSMDFSNWNAEASLINGYFVNYINGDWKS